MKRLPIILMTFLLFTSIAESGVIHHKKNTLYYLAIPMVETANPEQFDTGETVSDEAYYKDAAGSWTALAITDTFAEIGTTGIYEIDLTAAELNHDKVLIKITGASTAADTMVMFDMATSDIDDVALTSAAFDPSTTGVELLDSGGSAGTSADELVDDNWDEILTGATHNIATSSGRRLRQLEAATVLHTGTAQAGSSSSITLAAGAEASVDGFYENDIVVIVAGTGVGQGRKISSYTASTRVAIISLDWVVAPDVTSEYEVSIGTDTHVGLIHEDVIDATALATSAVDEQTDANWDEDIVPAHNTVGTSGWMLNKGQTSNYMSFVWIDTVNGSAGTDEGENGTPDNPVDTLADATILATSLGLCQFKIAAESVITLAQAYSGFLFTGNHWTLNLGNQSIAYSTFIGAATVSGTASDGGIPRFAACNIIDATIPPSELIGCGLKGTLTFASAGEFTLVNCYSGVPGLNTPTIDFGATLDASELGMRGYEGGMEIESAGAGSGTYRMSFDASGQLIINANCSATTIIRISGNVKLTDNSGSVTIDEIANMNSVNVNAEADTALTDYNALVPADTPGNWSLMDIDANGFVHADVHQILDSLLTQGAGTILAANFSQIFDVTPTTTNDVNDIGTATVGDVTVGAFTVPAMASLSNTDSGETVPVAGSVVKLAQGAAGGNVTVEAYTAGALTALDAIILNATASDYIDSPTTIGHRILTR